jgi:hypothetical protein
MEHNQRDGSGRRNHNSHKTVGSAAGQEEEGTLSLMRK